MVSFGVEREWTSDLRDLIARYGALRAAPRGSERGRGQKFNALIADLLRHWGIQDAEANVRGLEGRDEIDVTFSIDDSHYVLEAKWTATPVSADPVMKLASRVGQRLGGTRGIIVSMSGYTKYAASAAERGQQPEVLLLDRSHFEAILSGLLPPEELLRSLVRRLSRHGGVYVPLADLLIPQRPVPAPTVCKRPLATPPWNIVLDTAGGISVDLSLLGDRGWAGPTGICAAPQAGAVLVTTPVGIVEINTGDGTTSWALPVVGCRGTPVVDADGSLLTVCNYAVVRWRTGGLDIVGGGFTGNSTVFPGPDGDAWVFDNTGDRYAGLMTLTSLGTTLGDQTHHEIDFPAGVWNAAWLDRRRFFLAGDGHSGVVDLDLGPVVPRSAWIESPQAGPRHILVRDANTVVTAAREQGVRGSLYQTSVTSGANGRLIQLAVNSLLGATADGGGGAYVLADVRGNNADPAPVLLQVSGLAL